jgi:hypothetical protein
MSMPSENYGLLLNADSNKTRDYRRYFASMDASDSGTHPYLEVTYTTECTTHGDKPPCDGCVDAGEIGEYIDRWYASSQDVSMVQLVRALEKWKVGC